MERIYSEEDLIIPALFELHFNPNGMTTSMLIKALTKNLKPEGADAEILFGRNDTRFSQKVRNLISHKRLHSYVTTTRRGKDKLFFINEDGVSVLLGSEYYALNYQDRINDDQKEYDFDGEETFDTVENYNFIEKTYVSVENVNYTVYELKRKYDKTQRERLNGIEPQNGLILDESLSLLDSIAKDNVLNLLMDLKKKGMC